LALASGDRRRSICGERNNRDYVEDVSDYVDLKIAALREHHTQLDEVQGWEERVRQRMAEAGKDHGFAAAEAFKKLPV